MPLHHFPCTAIRLLLRLLASKVGRKEVKNRERRKRATTRKVAGRVPFRHKPDTNGEPASVRMCASAIRGAHQLRSHPPRAQRWSLQAKCADRSVCRNRSPCSPSPLELWMCVLNLSTPNRAKVRPFTRRRRPLAISDCNFLLSDELRTGGFYFLVLGMIKVKAVLKNHPSWYNLARTLNMNLEPNESGRL